MIAVLHCLCEASGNHEALHFAGNILLLVINPDMRHHLIPKIPSVAQVWAGPVGSWLGYSCQEHPAQRGWQNTSAGSSWEPSVDAVSSVSALSVYKVWPHASNCSKILLWFCHGAPGHYGLPRCMQEASYTGRVGWQMCHRPCRRPVAIWSSSWT